MDRLLWAELTSMVGQLTKKYPSEIFQQVISLKGKLSNWFLRVFKKTKRRSESQEGSRDHVKPLLSNTVQIRALKQNWSLYKGKISIDYNSRTSPEQPKQKDEKIIDEEVSCWQQW